MKIAYSKPAKNEQYLIEKKSAVFIVRSRCPDIQLLAFQAMHGPKMSAEIAYLATFSSRYIRVLSVQTGFVSDDLRAQFREHVMPYICSTAARYQETSYFWPAVIVAFDRAVYEVTCSDGGLFPDKDEILRDIKKRQRLVCSSR